MYGRSFSVILFIMGNYKSKSEGDKPQAEGGSSSQSGEAETPKDTKVCTHEIRKHMTNLEPQNLFNKYHVTQLFISENLVNFFW